MLPGTLKAKLATHELIEVVPMKSSKQPFKKYLAPSPFLNLKRKLASLDNQKFSFSNATRKHFGRKTVNISDLNSSRAYSIRNYYRYFTKVSFQERKENRRRLIPIKIVIKSLGDLMVFDEPLPVNKAIVRRILSVCSCGVSIVSSESRNTEWWLSLPLPSNIKHLELVFSKNNHSQLLETLNLFQNYTSLESCCISIRHFYDNYNDRYSYGTPGPVIIDFLATLCRIKSLKSLELDLQTKLLPETLTTLLCEIAMYEPPRWCLRASLSTIEIDKLKSILKKVDFLGLDASHTDVYEEGHDYEVKGYGHNPTADLSKMKHLTRKRKRILDLSAFLDLKPLLDSCSSLKGLYIKSIGPSFKFNEDVREQVQVENKKRAQEDGDENEDEDESENEDENKDKDEDEIEIEIENENEDNGIETENEGQNNEVKAWANNLEDVVFSFNNNTSKPDSTIENLLRVLQKQSANLKSLELFYCDSSDNIVDDYEAGRCRSLGRSDDMKMHLNGLEKIISLEELKLTTDGRDIRGLKPVLESLSNLKKLHLVFAGEYTQYPWDHSFPFQNCGNLQELRITINPDMTTRSWGSSFLEDCHYLQNLNLLSIYDPNSMNLKIFCSLVKKLMDLKNMRTLFVCTRVSSSFQNVPDGTLEGLKSQVKSFIHSNRNLEKLYIGNVSGFSFEHFKYA